jgi:hypothetical protein
VRGKGARNETRAPKNGDTDFVVLVFESSRNNFKTRRNRNDSRCEWNVDLSEVLSAAASEHGRCVWVQAGCTPCLCVLPFESAGSSIAEMQHFSNREGVDTSDCTREMGVDVVKNLLRRKR